MVAIIVALAVLVEIPIVAYILTRDDEPRVAVNASGAASSGEASKLPPHPMARHFKSRHTETSRIAMGRRRP